MRIIRSTKLTLKIGLMEDNLPVRRDTQHGTLRGVIHFRQDFRAECAVRKFQISHEGLVGFERQIDGREGVGPDHSDGAAETAHRQVTSIGTGT